MTANREALYVLTFGLTLVLAMAAVLFFLVGLNPKHEGYGALPWVYCGLSAAGAGVLWRVSGRLAGPTSAGR